MNVIQIKVLDENNHCLENIKSIFLPFGEEFGMGYANHKKKITIIHDGKASTEGNEKTETEEPHWT